MGRASTRVSSGLFFSFSSTRYSSSTLYNHATTLFQQFFQTKLNIFKTHLHTVHGHERAVVFQVSVTTVVYTLGSY